MVVVVDFREVIWSSLDVGSGSVGIVSRAGKGRVGRIVAVDGGVQEAIYTALTVVVVVAVDGGGSGWTGRTEDEWNERSDVWSGLVWQYQFSCKSNLDEQTTIAVSLCLTDVDGGNTAGTLLLLCLLCFCSSVCSSGLCQQLLSRESFHSLSLVINCCATINTTTCMW